MAQHGHSDMKEVLVSCLKCQHALPSEVAKLVPKIKTSHFILTAVILKFLLLVQLSRILAKPAQIVDEIQHELVLLLDLLNAHLKVFGSLLRYQVRRFLGNRPWFLSYFILCLLLPSFTNLVLFYDLHFFGFDWLDYLLCGNGPGCYQVYLFHIILSLFVCLFFFLLLDFVCLRCLNCCLCLFKGQLSHFWYRRRFDLINFQRVCCIPEIILFSQRFLLNFLLFYFFNHFILLDLLWRGICFSFLFFDFYFLSIQLIVFEIFCLLFLKLLCYRECKFRHQLFSIRLLYLNVLFLFVIVCQQSRFTIIAGFFICIYLLISYFLCAALRFLHLSRNVLLLFLICGHVRDQSFFYFGDLRLALLQIIFIGRLGITPGAIPFQELSEPNQIVLVYDVVLQPSFLTFNNLKLHPRLVLQFLRFNPSLFVEGTIDLSCCIILLSVPVRHQQTGHRHILIRMPLQQTLEFFDSYGCAKLFAGLGQETTLVLLPRRGAVGTERQRGYECLVSGLVLASGQVIGCPGGVTQGAPQGAETALEKPVVVGRVLTFTLVPGRRQMDLHANLL